MTTQGRGRVREVRGESVRVVTMRGYESRVRVREWERESNCVELRMAKPVESASLSRDVISLRRRIKNFFTYCSISLRRWRPIILNNSIRIEIFYMYIIKTDEEWCEIKINVYFSYNMRCLVTPSCSCRKSNWIKYFIERFYRTHPIGKSWENHYSLNSHCTVWEINCN